MKSFSSKSEMLEYGKSLGKCDKEIVSLDGKTVILCGTNLAYEDKISEIAETAITSVVKEFCLKKDITSDVRNRFAFGKEPRTRPRRRPCRRASWTHQGGYCGISAGRCRRVNSGQWTVKR